MNTSQENMNKLALVTGATAGIGEATAKALAKVGYDLIITGRRKDRLTELVKDIKSETDREIICLNFDIRSLSEVENAIHTLSPDSKKIDVLINNAGLAVGLNPIQDGVIDDWERMIDTNIKGLLYITRTVAPLMINNGGGTIINVGSIAAKEVYAKGNVYCGTKHAVDALTKGMRIDMLDQGIRVGAIHPGMVDTEFSEVRFKGNKEAADKVYEDLTPLYAEDIADAILFMVSRPAHVTINDLVIMPTVQANTSHTVRKEIPLK